MKTAPRQKSPHLAIVENNENDSKDKDDHDNNDPKQQ